MTMTEATPTTSPEGVLFDDGTTGGERGHYRMVTTQEIAGVDEAGRAVLDVFEEKRYCRFPPLGANDDEIEPLKRKSYADGVDFYDPRRCPGCDDGRPTGWLRNGRRPEHNHTRNEGRLATPVASRRVVLDEPKGIGAALLERVQNLEDDPEAVAAQPAKASKGGPS